MGKHFISLDCPLDNNYVLTFSCANMIPTISTCLLLCNRNDNRKCSFFFLFLSSTMFQNSLSVLKIYNVRNVNYRFSVLAMNFGTQPELGSETSLECASVSSIFASD